MLMAADDRHERDAASDLFVVWEASERADAFALATAGRRAGLAAQLDLGGRSVKGQMKQADRVGARYVAILYPDGTVLRDMDSGDEEKVERESVVPAVLKGRHAL
jgi:histidyl-tRNA synthetase